ncbi:hypothetical protein GS452_21330 [Rhodococcus hoagii]|nr:hypothetical protein [Prescottella equi]
MTTSCGGRTDAFRRHVQVWRRRPSVSNGSWSTGRLLPRTRRRPICSRRIVDRRAGSSCSPGFDEFILGYRDARAAVDPAFQPRLQPGNNGMFSPTVVANGRVVGTWKRASRCGRRHRRHALTVFDARTEKAIPRAYSALA